jgi:prepilin-type N-terminal cleavage/methylation domain-containing protein
MGRLVTAPALFGALRKGGGRPPAFTLVEMLAVIAVILILASLLIGTLGQARHRAIRVVCVNNLKQIYSLSVGFAQDSEGELPQGLSENPQQLSVRTNYTNFAAVDRYMRTYGLPPDIWYCPALPKERFGDPAAWGDPAYSGSGRAGSSGTPGEFPIGYFYVGNMTQASIWKFDVVPPRTLSDLLQTNAPLAFDFCSAPRPSPAPASDVTAWRSFPHYGVANPSVMHFLMAGGAVQARMRAEMIQRYHYIAPGEVYW